MNKSTEEKVVSALEWAEELGGDEIKDRLGAGEIVSCYQATTRLIEKKSKTPTVKVKKFHLKHKEAIEELKALISPLEDANSKLKERLCRWYEKNVYERETDSTWEAVLEDCLALEQAGKVEEAEALRATIPTEVEDCAIPGVQFREKWTFEIDNEDEIPRKYLVPNMSALREAVKSVRGVVKIPGIKVQKEAQAVISKNDSAKVSK